MALLKNGWKSAGNLIHHLASAQYRVVPVQSYYTACIVKAIFFLCVIIIIGIISSSFMR